MDLVEEFPYLIADGKGILLITRLANPLTKMLLNIFIHQTTGSINNLTNKRNKRKKTKKMI